MSKTSRAAAAVAVVMFAAVTAIGAAPTAAQAANGTDPGPQHSIVCDHVADTVSLNWGSRLARARGHWGCVPGAPEIHEVCVIIIDQQYDDPDEWPEVGARRCTSDQGSITTPAVGSITGHGLWCSPGVHTYATLLTAEGFHGNWWYDWDISSAVIYSC